MNKQNRETYKEQMKKAPIVSVLIPVYNTEKYLRECLDSVINQTLREIEIICIDDGSTDGSPAILREYAEADERIAILTQENKGSSAARNAGIEQAKGKYIYFTDSDDMVKPGVLAYLVENAEQDNTDILLFDAEVIYDSDEAYANRKHVSEDCYKRTHEYTGVKNGSDMFTAMMGNGDYKCNLYMQLINTAYIRKHNIRFYEGIIHQDDLFTFVCIMSAGRVKHITSIGYIRRLRSGSVVTAGFGGYYDFYSYLVVYMNIQNFISNRHYSDDTLRQINRYLNGIRNAIAMIYTNNDDSDEWLNRLEKEDRDIAMNILKPLISAIVPVYNVEPYLRRCLDSILSQTIGLHNLEIIIVNDGSTDGSTEILRKYKEKYNNVKLIEQENAGLGAARNRAVKIATGEYIAFVDSDDCLPPDAYENMYNATEDGTIDIVVGRTKVINPDGAVWFMYDDWPFSEQVKEISLDSVTDTMYKDLLRYAGVWSRLCRREFIVSNNIQCAEGIYFEAYKYTTTAHFCAQKAKVIDAVTYHYYKRPDSIMNSSCKRRFTDVYKGIELTYKEIEERGLGNLKHHFDLAVLDALLPHYNRLAEFTDGSCMELYSLTSNEYEEIASFILWVLGNTGEETMKLLEDEHRRIYEQLHVRLKIALTSRYHEIQNEDDRPLISVVIPVYNSAVYLHRCLDSVLEQTIGKENLQIVIVDDGSTDDSLEIIEEYKDKHNEIILIKQEKKGAGAARNTGLLYVTGKYLTFADSDDFIPPDAYERMYSATEAGKVDVVTGRMRVTFPDGTIRETADNIFINSDSYELPIDLFDLNMCHDLFKWSGMYLRLNKTELIINNGIACPENITVGNDIGFTVITQFCAKRAKVINTFVYSYVKRDDSSTGEKNKRNFTDIFEAIDYTYRAIERRGLNRYKHVFDYVVLNTHLLHRNRLAEFTSGECMMLYSLTENEYSRISSIVHKVVYNAHPEAFAQLDDDKRSLYAGLLSERHTLELARDTKELIDRYGAKRVVIRILKERLYPKCPGWVLWLYRKIRGR